MILWKEYSFCLYEAWFLIFFAVEAFTASWIEIGGEKQRLALARSRLSQPRGLKSGDGVEKSRKSCRGFHSLVDWNHLPTSLLHSAGTSRLSQPRGLKCPQYEVGDCGLSRGFHSLVDWNIKCPYPPLYKVVEAFTASWIEITVFSHNDILSHVEAFTASWIEIKSPLV